MEAHYIKIWYVLDNCPKCNGTGEIEEKEYHNQWTKSPCYRCGGKGKVKVQATEDCTREIAILRERLNKQRKNRQA